MRLYSPSLRGGPSAHRGNPALTVRPVRNDGQDHRAAQNGFVSQFPIFVVLYQSLTFSPFTIGHRSVRSPAGAVTKTGFVWQSPFRALASYSSRTPWVRERACFISPETGVNHCPHGV